MPNNFGNGGGSNGPHNQAGLDRNKGVAHLLPYSQHRGALPARHDPSAGVPAPMTSLAHLWFYYKSLAF